MSDRNYQSRDRTNQSRDRTNQSRDREGAVFPLHVPRL